MTPTTHGIHHVTAISGDPQETLDLYGGLLGLRLVKKTVNFDDPGTYHLYFGNDGGDPGTIMTFFPWGRRGLKGRPGSGQLTTVAFSVPADSLGFWTDRLSAAGQSFEGPLSGMSEEVIRFRDADGIELELVGSDSEARPGVAAPGIPAEHAIRGFFGVTLALTRPSETARLMTSLLGYQYLQEEENRQRLAAGDHAPGTYVDLLDAPQMAPGRMGVGAVHHVAWRISGDAEQLALRELLLQRGFSVSPVMDRNYFHSIYFREPGQVLFEVATDPPGFTVDEAAESLGEKLQLPSWLENDRAHIEERLPVLRTPRSMLTGEGS